MFFCLLMESPKEIYLPLIIIMWNKSKSCWASTLILTEGQFSIALIDKYKYVSPIKTKQKMARRHNKEGGNHLEQESNRQKTMEDIDGGLHTAVDGQSQGEKVKVPYICKQYHCAHSITMISLWDNCTGWLGIKH